MHGKVSNDVERQLGGGNVWKRGADQADSDKTFVRQPLQQGKPKAFCGGGPSLVTVDRSRCEEKLLLGHCRSQGLQGPWLH